VHTRVDAVNVMAAYQPVELKCVHCGGRIETTLCLMCWKFSRKDMVYWQHLETFQFLNVLAGYGEIHLSEE